ncbi:MAG: O-antigen ligase family protein [Kofleriaceae bacterium]|nr:O-antigen ligase family protein [Kofleriaceae bacterium]
MFVIPGIAALVMFLLARPQEFMPVLTRVPLLYILCAAAVGGLVLDLKLRRVQPVAAPALLWVVIYMLWAIICTAIKAPPTLITRVIDLGIIFVVFYILGHGIQRLRALQVVAGALMATALFLTAVCFHQGFADRQCIALDPGDPEQGVADGRPCELRKQCEGGDADPSLEYRCEKSGLFGTWAIEDRVRYRGELHDPNELSLTICVFGFSFLIAFMLRNKSPSFKVLGGLAAIMLIWTIFMTQSRGGLVVMMLVPGTYLVRKYGVRMLFFGALVALPVLSLGGRSGESADESTMQRYEAWAAGYEMWRESPIFGVGMRRFTDHHFLTAHNSFVLSLGELGFLGLCLFVALMYISGKVLILGLRELNGVPGTETARVWGMSLLASLLGLNFQIGTISFAYHSVTWILLGFIAAWGTTVRTHRPTFSVRLTGRDLAIIVVVCGFYAAILLPIFLKLKGAM